MIEIIPEKTQIGGYLSVAAAAERTGYQLRTITYLAKTGAVGAIRISHVLLIEQKSLDVYTAHRRATGSRRMESEA